MKKLEEVHTPYNRVAVWQNNAGRIDLEVSGATHATWHPTKLLTGHAWDAITAATVSHPGPLDSVLLLGLGGGTCLRQLRHLYPRIRMTAVEIDPEMINLARRYMGLDALDVTVIEADAFAYLRQTPEPADVVIDDLYHALGDDVERPLAITPAYLEQLQGHLNPAGSVVMNFVVGPGHNHMFQQACSSFRHAFASNRRIVPPLSHNEVLLGTRHPDSPASPRVLQEWAKEFTDREDREHWKELRTLKLR